MAEDNRVLEHLRAIRATQEDHGGRLNRIESRLSSMEQHMSQMLAMAGSDRDTVDRLARRIERIERRLELSD